MKSNTKKVISFGFIHALHRWSACASAILLTLVALSAFCKDGDHGQGNDNEGDRNRGNSDDYQVVNLVSDQAGVAMLQDTNLVNAWGISFGATSPFWVSANGTGKARSGRARKSEDSARKRCNTFSGSRPRWLA